MRSTLETFIHLQSNAAKSSSLTIADQLYKLEDTLSNLSKKGTPPWLGLGKRALPIPDSWGSDDKNDLVISFNNAQVKSFQILWKKRNGEPEYPPGIAKINTNGGTVKLPGVGQLTLPPNAVTTPTVVRLEELTETLQPIEWSSAGREIRNFSTSVVKVHTETNTFSVPALLELELQQDLIGKNTPLVSNWSAITNQENESYWLSYQFENTQSNASFTHIMGEGTYARTTNHFINAETQFKLLESPKDDFKINQSSGCTSYYNPTIFSNASRPDLIEYVNSHNCFLNEVFDYYSKLILAAGGSVPPNGLNNGLQPAIYIVDDNGSVPRTYPNGYLLCTTDLGCLSQKPGQDTFFGKNPYFMMIMPTPDKSSGFEETLAHEMWHVFQYQNTVNWLTGVGFYSYHKWLMEGPATHMGAKSVLKFGQKKAPHYIEKAMRINQTKMHITVDERGGEGYDSSGFFSFYAHEREEELSLAKIAVNGHDINDMLNANKNFGYEAFKKTFFLQVPRPNDMKPTVPHPPDVGVPVYKLLGKEHTIDNPLQTPNIVHDFATTYHRFGLDRSIDDKSYNLMARVKNLSGNSSARLAISPNGDVANAQGEYILGSEYTKISNFTGRQAAFVIISNGDTSRENDEHIIEMALVEKNKRVTVNISSKYSTGIDPVTVKLNIIGSDDKPFTGKVFLSLDKWNEGGFKPLNDDLFPFPNNDYYRSYGYVDVFNGVVILHYKPRFYTGMGDIGRRDCGGSGPCKARSARIKVYTCDFTYSGQERCPFIGPGKDIYTDSEESDEGRIHTTWLQDMGPTQRVSIKADGNKTDLQITGLRDNAGNPLPDGFPIYIDEPYKGSVSGPEGQSGVGFLIAWVKDETVKFRYKSPVFSDPCYPWPGYSTGASIVFDDSRYRQKLQGTSHIISLTPRKTGCN